MRRFRTARLVADPVIAADVPVFQRLWGDERVARMIGGVRDEATVRRSIVESVEHWQAHGFGRWLLRRGEDAIGYVKLEHTDVTGRRDVGLGYALFAEHWGKGYATEAARGALSVAADAGVATVVAYALTANSASFAVMQRLRFVEEQRIDLPEGPHAVWRLQLAADGSTQVRPAH